MATVELAAFLAGAHHIMEDVAMETPFLGASSP
jgi:hypothetical protein